MKPESEIKTALKDMETRKRAYMLDMARVEQPNSVVYSTDLIRKLEVTDATIHTLKWVLTNKKNERTHQIILQTSAHVQADRTPGLHLG